MRLIDADELLQEFETETVCHNKDLWHITGIKAYIENAPTVNAISGREYVSKYGSCPMCEDCPDGCPLDKQ